MHLNPNAYALIGLTAMVAALLGILVFAVLKFASAARESRLHLRENKSESAFVTAALHEALTNSLCLARWIRRQPAFPDACLADRAIG